MRLPAFWSPWLPALVAFALLATQEVHAQVSTTIYFSSDANETFQGNATLDEEVWLFDTTLTPGSEISGPLAQTGSSLFDGDESIDGFEVLGGIYYFSTRNDATVSDNSLDIDSNDIIRYDPGAPVGSRASLYYDPDADSTGQDVTAISIHTDGDLLLSFRDTETFAGLGLGDGDVVKFDIADPDNTRTIFFSESTFIGGDEDIRGFDYVSDTEMYIVIQSTASLPGLTDFTEMEVALWDGSTASLVIAEADFVNTTSPYQLNAVTAGVPEPSTTLLAWLSSLLWNSRRRRARLCR